MTVHLFGAASSPGCASFGLKRVAVDNEVHFGSKAANFIQDDFYVDDGLTSVSTPEEAISLINSTKGMCTRGGLRLHKFLSNSKEVMAAIPPTERAKGLTDHDLQMDDLPIERALGIHWCVESDTFRFRITLKDQPLTRRGILSTISSIYDPLGFVAPVLLVGKQILQQMCREGADWDSPLSDTLRSRWDRWRSNLFPLEAMKIKRCLKTEELGEIKSMELHHFSDASTSGYGQCSYLRLIDDQDQVHCSFLIGKARVSPMKSVTIPRLELTAALISAKISTMLKRELKFKQCIEEVFWTDSKVVLGYISNNSRRFHVFVANRVEQIRDQSEPTQWRFVRTSENPADDASRGISAYELINGSKWLVGPDFLWKRELPEDKAMVDAGQTLSEDDPEVKKIITLATHGNETQFELECLEYFSTWNRARRAYSKLYEV